ncbi:unnamed protein product [Miscanthus lutarioriparius]|uniref:Uncharacterized protein n=1 Tax=Miscanthus lutarioriparius TaxID=422564 RepID=A0A811RI29_9POAL|nr:unnamed protein product [Miscanthus lutarioriparius]
MLSSLPPHRTSSWKPCMPLRSTSNPSFPLSTRPRSQELDEKKIARLVLTVKMATDMINAAPLDKKLKVMEDSFNSVAAPSPLDCPTVDKAYCEMHSKVEKAVNGVTAAAPAGKMSEAQAAVVKETLYNTGATISKAYADGDEKKIAQVLAAYGKAADAVIAAAPADKLIVLEKTFATAAAGN